MSKDKSKSPKPDEGGADDEGGFVSTDIFIKLSHVYAQDTITSTFQYFFSVSGLGRLKYIFLVRPKTKVIVSQTILCLSVI